MQNTIEEAAKQKAIYFGAWYSGMELEQVASAYNIYLKEVPQLADASKEEPKELEELRTEFDNFASDQFMSLDNIWNFFLPHLSGVSNTKRSEQ